MIFDTSDDRKIEKLKKFLLLNYIYPFIIGNISIE